MIYNAIDKRTNQYIKNVEGKRITLSEVTKRTYDMFQEEFDLFGDVRLVPAPVVDSMNSVVTYQGGVNDND